MVVIYVPNFLNYCHRSLRRTLQRLVRCSTMLMRIQNVEVPARIGHEVRGGSDTTGDD
jgi:hypothetical protein